jgi:tetratricopeptide (TPR) repeat protein
MRAYCDLIASATSKLTSGRENARGALSEAEAALKLAPDRPAAKVLEARALERLGKPEEAFESFTQAQKLEPRSLDEPVVLLSFARTLARTKRLPEAEAAYRTLLPRASFLDTRERSSAYLEAGLLLLSKGQGSVDEAVAVFRQARAESQDSARAVSIVLLALALDRSGDLAQAQAVLGDRGDPRSLFEEARIKDIFEIVSAQPEQIAAVAEALGREKPQEARDAWSRYLKAVPKGPWAEHAQKRLQVGGAKPAPGKAR